MDFFDKHKALIITVLCCSVLILALYNFNLSEKRKIPREMLVDLENFTTEDKAKEEETPKKEPIRQTSPNSSETHRAFNENQEARDQNFDKKLDEILNESSAKQKAHSANKASLSSEGNIAKANKSKQRERSDGDDSSKEISTQSGSLRNSSISFSLHGRNAVSIPNPIYTCDLPGKIVVNIMVDAEGKVIDAAINDASSESDNECLTEKALEYAVDALFSPLEGRNEQPGTITYNFKP